jgi:hypothetical protein
LNNHAITCLSTLPRLRKLHCRLWDTRQGASRFPFFRTLQELSLTATEPEDCLSFLACLDAVKLSRVSLYLDSEGNGDHHGLPLALQQHVSNSSLKEVRISYDYSDDRVISGDILRPLLSFTYLTLLHFHPGSPFVTDNSMIKDISKACPRLQYLSLGEDHGSEGHTRVTLAGLIPLVQHCPDLRHLGIVVDASNPDYRSYHNQDQSASNHNIKDIWVGDSRITEPSAVASFLSNIFPELHAIHLSLFFDETDGYKLRKRLWNEVEGLVQLFTRKRNRERFRDEVFDNNTLSEKIIDQ